MITAPFIYVPVGIVLGDVGAMESIRRSIRLARARFRLAVVASLFSVVAQFILVFAASAGIDLVIRVLEPFRSELEQVDTTNAGGFLLVASGTTIGIFAYWTLTFTVSALTSGPQVVAFLGLTGYSRGLDGARDAAPGEPARPAPIWMTHPDARRRGDRGGGRGHRHRIGGELAHPSVEPELLEAVVVDAQVVGQLVDDRHPDLVGKVVGVGEVLLERDPEQADLVRERREVRAPGGPRRALVESVERIVPTEPGDLELLVGGVVLDDDRDLVERGPERGRDLVQGTLDEALEAVVRQPPAGEGGAGAAAAFGHDPRILGPMDLSADALAALAPAADLRRRAGRVRRRAGAGRADPLPRLGWPGPARRVRASSSSTAWPGRPGAGPRWPAGSAAPSGRSPSTCADTDCRTRRRPNTTPTTLADDVVAVAEGSGLLEAAAGRAARRVVLVGHGFGGMVAAWAAAELGDRCAGLVLVDGGWQDVALETGTTPAEFLRDLAEPPEVLSSIDAYLDDRRSWDVASWDADEERAARATVVEVPAGHVVPAIRPHALERSVEAIFEYRPLETLASLDMPIVALVAVDDEDRAKEAALAELDSARRSAGLAAVDVARFPDSGHNLPRYRPAALAGAILRLTGG